MKLKTLKDMKPADKFHRNKFSVRMGVTELVEKGDLKQEAIKRVKSNNTGGFSFAIGPKGVIRHNRRKEKMLTIDWVNLGAMIELINFFNITEEDLK